MNFSANKPGYRSQGKPLIRISNYFAIPGEYQKLRGWYE